VRLGRMLSGSSSVNFQPVQSEQVERVSHLRVYV
jgi:hypothetical protein